MATVGGRSHGVWRRSPLTVAVLVAASGLTTLPRPVADEAAALANPVRIMLVGDSITSGQTLVDAASTVVRTGQWPTFRGALYEKLTGSGSDADIGAKYGHAVDFVGSEDGVGTTYDDSVIDASPATLASNLACPSTNPDKQLQFAGEILDCDYTTAIDPPAPTVDVPYPLVDPDHEGHSGWTVDELTGGKADAEAVDGDLADWMAAETPDIVVFYAGTNDLGFQGQEPAGVLEDLRDAIHLMQSADPDVRIVVPQLHPHMNDANRTAGIIELNELIPDLVDESTATSPVITADLFTGYCAAQQPDPQYVAPIPCDHYNNDGSHPNRDGHALIARRLGDAMEASGYFDEVPTPSITGVSSPSLARGTVNAPVELTGATFLPGATFDLGTGVTVTSAEYRSPTSYDLTVDVARFAPAGAATLRMTNPGGGTATRPNALTLLAQQVDPALKVMVLGDDVAAGLPSDLATDPTFRGPLHDQLDGRSYDVTAQWAPQAVVAAGAQRPVTVSFVGGEHGIGAAAPAVESTQLTDQDHEAHPGVRLADLARFASGGSVVGSLPGWLDAHDPDVVVVNAGYADVAAMTAATAGQAANVIARFEPILDAILDHNPYARVIVTDLTPSRSGQTALYARIGAFNAALAGQLTPIINRVLADHAVAASQVLYTAGDVEIETLSDLSPAIGNSDLVADPPYVHPTDGGPAQALTSIAAEIADGAADTRGYWSALGTQRPAAPTKKPTVTAGVTDAVVGWTDPPFNFDAGPVRRYEVVATPVGGGAPVVHNVVLAGAGHDPVDDQPAARSTLLSGLDPGTAYRFTVRAVSLRGTGPASPATTAATKAAPATVDAGPDLHVAFPGPAMLDGTVTGASSVGWTKVSGPGSVVLGTPTAADTTVRFGAVGTYVMRLSATNPQGTVSDTTTVTVTSPAATPAAGSGYFVLEGDGDLYAFGDARSLLRTMDPAASDVGATAATVSRALASQMGGATAVAIEKTADGGGLWVLLDDGRVLRLGSAPAAPGVAPELLTGSVAGQPERVSAMARVGDGDLWVFTTAGRVLSQFGTLPAPVGAAMDVVLGLDLLGPVVDAKPTLDGTGVVAMAADGGIFTYDAPFLGSVYDAIASVLVVPVGSVGPDRPVVGVTMDPDGDGYWVVAEDGGVFTMRTPFRGALPAIVPFDQLVSPVNGMVPLGNGYLLVAGDGGVFNFSDQAFAGSASGLVDTSVVGIVAL